MLVLKMSVIQKVGILPGTRLTLELDSGSWWIEDEETNVIAEGGSDDILELELDEATDVEVKTRPGKNDQVLYQISKITITRMPVEEKTLIKIDDTQADELDWLIDRILTLDF